MHTEQSSIFDKEFLLETQVRRRRLMPLALKIYVWFYLVISAFFLLCVAWLYPTLAEEGKFSADNPRLMIVSWVVISFFALFFLSGVFILLERKWSILFTSILTGINISLFGASFAINLYRAQLDFTSDLIIQAGWILLMLPYLVLLLKIRPDWISKAVSGK